MSEAYDPKIFGHIERFIKIKIGENEFEVPDRLELLRVFQFLDFQIDYAKLCWNGSCHRCVISFNEKANLRADEALSCRVKSSDGMCVRRLPPTIRPK